MGQEPTENVGDQESLLFLLHDHLQSRFGCHTAILYGSRARGDWDQASDIDVIAFCDAGETGHLAHRWQDLFLDLFVYPSGTKPEPNWLRVHGGLILFQRGAEGDEILDAIGTMFRAGPEPRSDSAQQTLRLWCEKMLMRAEKEDPEGNHRRHWLLSSLLEIYFDLRNQWYLGPKRSLVLLRDRRPEDFEVFRAAFEPSASLANIRAAVAMVTANRRPL